MPDYHYNFLGGGAACGGGPGAPLIGGPNPVALTPAELINAQLRLGVYPGGGWDIEEITWRVYSFCIGCIMVAGGGGPGVPAVPPAVGVAVPGGGLVAGAAANLPPSPVAVAVDATEKGQIGYHMGTAVGGALGPYMAHTGPGGTLWFAYHLTRAIQNGATFTFAPGGAPDIVSFAMNPATGWWYEWVVWENKGHCGNFGGLAAIAPALAQAQLIVNMTLLPGGLGAGWGGPWAPDAAIASQVDAFFGNFRVQLIDPSGGPRKPRRLDPRGLERFLASYYRPFAELMGARSQARAYGKRRFQTILLPKDIRFGLDDEILQGYRSGNLAAAVARATAGGYGLPREDTLHIDQTGISVELPKGWRSSEGDRVVRQDKSSRLQELNRNGG